MALVVILAGVGLFGNGPLAVEGHPPDQIKYAVLERNGTVTVIPKEGVTVNP